MARHPNTARTSRSAPLPERGGKVRSTKRATTAKAHWSDALVAMGACVEAVEWARRHSTLQEAWDACQRCDWMMWLLWETEDARASQAFEADQDAHRSYGGEEPADAIRRVVPIPPPLPRGKA